jgi:hypothetical protein
LQYAEASRAKVHIKSLGVKELRRQEENMQRAQWQEMEQIQGQQQRQFVEFSRAWDDYMGNYEVAAGQSVQRLKEKHVKELEEMIEHTYSHHTVKYTLSRELMNVRAQEKLMF